MKGEGEEKGEGEREGEEKVKREACKMDAKSRSKNYHINCNSRE
jgi:hypothetical protein